MGGKRTKRKSKPKKVRSKGHPFASVTAVAAAVALVAIIVYAVLSDPRIFGPSAPSSSGDDGASTAPIAKKSQKRRARRRTAAKAAEATKVQWWGANDPSGVLAQLAAPATTDVAASAVCPSGPLDEASDGFDVEAAGRSCREQALPFLTRDGSSVRGFHVICVVRRPCAYSVFPFWRGRRAFATIDGATDVDQIFVDRRDGVRGAFAALLSAEPRLRFLGAAEGQKQVGSLFTDDGYRREPGTLPVGLSLAFEGGQFIWPGIAIGFTRVVNVTSPRSGWRRTLTLQTLAMVPLVLSVSSFLEVSECEHIIEFSTPHMAASGVSLMDKDKGKEASEWRTSSTFFMHSQSSQQLQEIDWRVASVTRLPRSHQEDLQVLRYEKTQRYVSHHDFFAPHLYKESPDTMHLIQGGHRNRLVTVFWYMTNVEAGGTTYFPRAQGHSGLPRGRAVDFSSCDPDVGLHVAPQQGKIILFYSMKPDGSFSDESLHGGCPVVNGTKWAANKWVWNKPVRDANDNYNPN